jgi:hypothetical protein
VDHLQYLQALVETLRDEQREFRDELVDKLNLIEKWAAVHEARDEALRKEATTRNKQLAWLFGLLFTAANTAVTLFFK